MQIPAVLLPHTVTVRPYLGTGAYGDVWGDPVVVREVFVEDRRRLVRNQSGEELVSESTVRTRPGVRIPVSSKVTVWQGTPLERTGRVITTSVFEHLSTWSHIEIALS
ncbi:hypothetical protein SAMN04488074_109209 [Lentzea albidocapillata subsp. violacea]|uniref:Head-to-tail stopper n=1 Tax=Lentzea albidocapillata subsp. violacea TaxID=128104 RepID=A0A1G9HZ99_9PSEU|nr:hypothetical protein [Lentzea albidocapillata]SDL17994.1 hypothetical protein SAMN04488074_109209 [Lentzea albidocapillata subsp. violacea]